MCKICTIVKDLKTRKIVKGSIIAIAPTFNQALKTAKELETKTGNKYIIVNG